MKIAFIGHSHLKCLERASKQLGDQFGVFASFVQLRNIEFSKDRLQDRKTAPPQVEDCDLEIVARHVVDASDGAALTVLCPNGTEHYRFSLLNNGDNCEGVFKARINQSMQKNYNHWLTALRRYVRSPAVVIPPPPPIESEAFIREHSGGFAEKIAAHGIAPAQTRLQAWLHQKRVIHDMAESLGLRFLDLPAEVFSERGFLREHFIGREVNHANEAYGELMLRYVAAFATGPEFTSNTSVGLVQGGDKAALDVAGNAKAHSPNRQHPYIGLPDRAFWKQAVAQVPPHQFDPVGDVPFRISRSDKVATAGSCFAQHISKRLRSGGFQFLVTESPAGDAVVDSEGRGIYDFSARYGNIYTARQLVQLFDRAFGYFSPDESHWRISENRFCDPFRPRIEPDGFSSVAALAEDRQRHLQAVREMFEQLDVFVFTLGLTECWVSQLDGAAYPLAPGVAGGEFDPSKYAFVNFGVNEVVSDLQLFIHKLRFVNPKARLILTVSPVALAATYEPNHVLVSTTYSKSVLRVAAEMISRASQEVYYFPSYEIITGSYNRGRYFGPDFRSVTEEGVDHVMSVFMRHLTEGGDSVHPPGGHTAEVTELEKEMMALAEAACDEELLEKK